METVTRLIKLYLLKRVVRVYVRELESFPVPIQDWHYEGPPERTREAFLRDRNAPLQTNATICLLELGNILQDPRLPEFRSPSRPLYSSEGEYKELFLSYVRLYGKRLRLRDIPKDKWFWTIEGLLKEVKNPSWRRKVVPKWIS